VTVYQGIRRDESQSRRDYPQSCWNDEYDAQVERPLFHWTAEECFALMAQRGVKPNPLYLLGAGRVGCFPCVMVNLRELKTLSITVPEIRERIRELERLSGRFFFKPGYIPERFCNGYDAEREQVFPTSQDVFRYLDSVDEDQLPLLPARSCMSVYNLCE